MNLASRLLSVSNAIFVELFELGVNLYRNEKESVIHNAMLEMPISPLERVSPLVMRIVIEVPINLHKRVSPLALEDSIAQTGFLKIK